MTLDRPVKWNLLTVNCHGISRKNGLEFAMFSFVSAGVFVIAFANSYKKRKALTAKSDSPSPFRSALAC